MRKNNPDASIVVIKLQIRVIGDMDCDRYKLFVGGIPRGTSEESLKQHFSRYGAVLGAVVAKEKATGQPRGLGFGFVRFASAYDVDKALRDSHYILSRAVD
ncbi:hypothetical protein YC2023_004757 [Brassica napus]